MDPKQVLNCQLLEYTSLQKWITKLFYNFQSPSNATLLQKIQVYIDQRPEIGVLVAEMVIFLPRSTKVAKAVLITHKHRVKPSCASGLIKQQSCYLQLFLD